MAEGSFKTTERGRTTLILKIFIFLQLATATYGELDLVWATAVRVDERLILEPQPPPGYFVIGQYVSRYAETRYENERITNPDLKIPVARSTQGSDELAEPLNFEMMIYYRNGKLDFWRMNCPENYVALSGIATKRNLDGTPQIPDINKYRCVSKNITTKVDIYFFFLANGKYGIWAMQVTGNSIGSYYAVAEPRGEEAKAVGYHLIPTPRNYTSSATAPLEETAASTEETTALHSSMSSTLASITGETSTLPKSIRGLLKLFAAKAEKTTVDSPTTTKATEDLTTQAANRIHIIIIIASGIIIVISLLVIWLIACRRVRSKKPRSPSMGAYTSSVSTELSEFVYQDSTTSPAGSISGKSNPRASNREMRINMLYEHTTPRDLLINALHRDTYPRTIKNPLYVPSSVGET